VETVAVMAHINPFFEHAGMKRIAESKPATAVTKALQQLNTLGFNPTLLANLNYNEHTINKTSREAVTTILTDLSLHDSNIRKRLTATRNIYPKHEEFTTKITKLNAYELAKVLKRLSFTAQSKIYLLEQKMTTKPQLSCSV
jgi:hypothetical protein